MHYKNISIEINFLVAFIIYVTQLNTRGIIG